MAGLNQLAYTLADWRGRLDPSGNVDDIIEVLSQSNPILEEMTFMEGNLPTGIVTTQRTKVPEPSIRRINTGVPYKKSGVKQINDTTTLYENRNKMDVELLRLQNSVIARI